MASVIKLLSVCLSVRLCRAALKDDSNQGFKSMEAKELATEVERAHPNESAGQIAKRAMKLLNVIMAKSHSSLPSLGQTGPSGI